MLSVADATAVLCWGLDYFILLSGGSRIFEYGIEAGYEALHLCQRCVLRMEGAGRVIPSRQLGVLGYSPENLGFLQA